jgi:hypothetical protein
VQLESDVSNIELAFKVEKRFRVSFRSEC